MTNDDVFEAKMALLYKDDGDNISVKMTYKDSNGVNSTSDHKTDSPDKVGPLLIHDIMNAMKENKANKAKEPKDMSKEELIEALKLMESEANTQRTRADMLQKRLKYENKKVDRKNVIVEKPAENVQRYDNVIEYILQLLG